MKKLESQVAIITGGTGSVATTVAEILREQGAKILLVDEDKEALQNALHRLGVGSGDDLAYEVGSNSADPSHYKQKAIERFGNANLYITLHDTI